ncbi:MAG TPA: hypothetical protein VGB75_02115 [Jatrophihabitans sp.]|jgi:hypothetical protein|uniref:hypothetical protein n=1 Tax=Jatrophihabitans sp. TaxID=1932789 RepID=UPI002EEB22D0
MTDVPADGTAVVLRDQQGRAYRSEVARSQPGVLFLQPPRDLPATGAFALGTRLLVTWPDETSLRVLPVMLLSVATSGEVGMLAVQVQGTAWREERRRYARANLDASLSIGYAGADGQDVQTSGELIDLSEVALRGVVPPEHQALCQPRTPVRMRIGLADDSFEIGGYILLGKPAARVDLGLEVVVLFHRPVARVEDLRRHLGNLVGGG